MAARPAICYKIPLQYPRQVTFLKGTGIENVVSRSAKLILGLSVLLACPELGLGNRAQASFALAPLSREQDRPKCSLGFEFELVLNGEESKEIPGTTSAGAVRDEAPAAPGPAQPPTPRDLRGLFHVQDGLQSNGASSSSPAPSSGPGGSGLYLVPPQSAQVLGVEVSEFLFLTDNQFKPPAFPSRLFRPPRHYVNATL